MEWLSPPTSPSWIRWIITPKVALVTSGRNLGATSYAHMRKPRRQTKSSNFRITGYVGGREYSGLRCRKNYYNKATDQQSIPYRGKNGKPIWLKFLQKGIVEDCPICNPDILLMYRLNPENDEVVETNFEMTREIAPQKWKVNYRKNKSKHACKHPKYDHHHHQMNAVRDNKGNQVYASLTPDKIHSFVEKYGKSINKKIKFKKNQSQNSSYSKQFKNKSRSIARKNQKKPKSYAQLYRNRPYGTFTHG